jgi:lipopolysaccharide export system ATP-binding protein
MIMWHHDPGQAEARTFLDAPAAWPGLSVVSLVKSFGDRAVLRGVTLDVHPGEVVGLLGPDGAGKSVCFYTIIGLLRADAGRVMLDGVDVTQLPTYRRALLGLSYLPQEQSIFRGLTVAENIAAILEMSEHDPDVLGRKLDRLLREFDIAHLRDVPATKLSGGERRRCEIARALAGDPSVILLDEPFAGIDPKTIDEIKALVVRLRERGVGVLITDQDLHDMLEIMDRTYVLFEGEVIYSGEPGAMLDDARVQNVYLGADFPIGTARS